MFDKNLLALLGREKRYVVFIVICNLLSTISNIVITFAICHIVNFLIIGEKNITAYIPAFAFALGGALVRFILSLLNGNFGAKLGTNAKELLRKKIYDKIARLGVRETDELSLASLTQVAVEGVEQLDLYYSTYIPQFFYSVISPFILFALLMFISRSAAIVLICCVPLIPISIIGVSKYAKKIFAKYWGQYAKMGDAFLDNISGMKELKIFNADGAYHEKMNSEAEDFRKITMKVLTMQLASTTIMDLVAYGGTGLGIAIAVFNREAINPIFNMQTPALVLFIVLIAVDFFLPLRALGSAFHVSMNGATAGKKILTLLNTPEPEWGSEKLTGYDVKLQGVDFSYDGSRQILNDINIQAEPGKLTAIVGQSGCGKSTVISLMSGARAAASGTVSIGGKAINTLSREDFYKHAGVVSYNTFLFNATIKENFRLARPEISDEIIYEYLAKVNLDGFVRASGGTGLCLKEDSANISGGQRQRLALAVNLSAEKDIYFFDEITSNIDAESEKIIMDNIYALAKEKTVVLVSHRLKNVAGADRIYVLDGGCVVQEGTHEELIRGGGIYGALLSEQKALEEGVSA